MKIFIEATPQIKPESMQISETECYKQLNKNGIYEANNILWKQLCKLKECEAN